MKKYFISYWYMYNDRKENINNKIVLKNIQLLFGVIILIVTLL